MSKAPRPSKAEKEAAKAARKTERDEEKARKAEVKRLAAEEAAAEKRRIAEERERTKHNEKNMNAAERQALFITHNTMWSRLADEQKSLDKKKDEAVKAAKNDGFSKKMLDVALKMDDPEKDAKLRAEVRALLQVAAWKGAPIDTRFDLFGGATPPKDQATVTDQAYAEGRTASAHNQPRRVPVQYPAPGEAFNAWLAGYDDHQRELMGGIKQKPDAEDLRPPELRAKEAERAESEKLGPDQVKSGTPVRRSDYESGLADLGEKARKIITDAGGTPPGPGGESSSEALKRQQGIADEE